MKFVRTLWLWGALGVLSTIGHLVDTTMTTGISSSSSSSSWMVVDTGLPAAFSRNLQSSFTTANPRAPLHQRTPDGVAAPNSISQEELQALLLAKSPTGLISGSSNREGGEDDDNKDRQKFLLFVVIIPTLALLAGAYVLLVRVRRKTNNKGNVVNETEGLFQTPTDETQQEQPYYQDVPHQGFAERRPNVI
eukprot:scaffold31414_cov183-Amphora_coffeaeformis.AAC.9